MFQVQDVSLELGEDLAEIGPCNRAEDDGAQDRARYAGLIGQHLLGLEGARRQKRVGESLQSGQGRKHLTCQADPGVTRSWTDAQRAWPMTEPGRLEACPQPFDSPLPNRSRQAVPVALLAPLSCEARRQAKRYIDRCVRAVVNDPNEFPPRVTESTGVRLWQARKELLRDGCALPDPGVRGEPLAKA